MAEYTCKKKDCDGTVKFPTRSADPPADLKGTRIWFCPGFVDTKVMGHCTGTLKR